jgi:hypothetical protein
MRLFALIFFLGAFSVNATNTTSHTAMLFTRPTQNPKGMAASGAMHGGLAVSFAVASALLVNGLGVAIIKGI